MATDRQLGPLAQLNSPWQPAVLRLIQLTVAGAAEEGNGKPVGVCGEAAADPALAVVLVGLGVSTLSMTSRSLAVVGTVLKSVTLDQAQELAGLALTPTRSMRGPGSAPNCPSSKISASKAPYPRRNSMLERTATVASRSGLHARPAALFAEAAGNSPVEVSIARAGTPADEALNAGSIVSLMTLGAAQGDSVILRVEGDGAAAALDSLVTMLETDLDAE